MICKCTRVCCCEMDKQMDSFCGFFLLPAVQYPPKPGGWKWWHCFVGNMELPDY
jgi:hypothetical protein